MAACVAALLVPGRCVDQRCALLGAQLPQEGGRFAPDGSIIRYSARRAARHHQPSESGTQAQRGGGGAADVGGAGAVAVNSAASADGSVAASIRQHEPPARSHRSSACTWWLLSSPRRSPAITTTSKAHHAKASLEDLLRHHPHRHGAQAGIGSAIVITPMRSVMLQRQRGHQRLRGSIASRQAQSQVQGAPAASVRGDGAEPSAMRRPPSTQASVISICS